MRIDHKLLSQSLLNTGSSSIDDKEPSAWEQPSDHAPVIAMVLKQSP